MTIANYFNEIALDPVELRPLASRPAPLIATNLFVREVQEALNDKTSQEQADWVLNKMESFAAFFAQPVFDMEGGGPLCSFCTAIWPLCGHHHMSGLSDEEINQQ